MSFTDEIFKPPSKSIRDLERELETRRWCLMCGVEIMEGSPCAQCWDEVDDVPKPKYNEDQHDR